MSHKEGEVTRAREEFVALLRRARMKNRNLPYRMLCERSYGELSLGSVSRLLNGEGWPNSRVVDAFLLACQADRETARECVAAWERLIDLRGADQMSAKRPAGTDCHECGAYVPTENVDWHHAWHRDLTDRFARLAAEVGKER